MTVKIQVKFAEQNIRNGFIRRLVSTSMHVVCEHFLRASAVFRILLICIFQDILRLEKYRSMSRCTSFAKARLDGSISLYKRRNCFFASSHCLPYIKYYKIL